MSGLDEKGQIEPCGGCGEADPLKRCINCHHEFFPNRRASATPADVGEEPVAWGVFRDGKMVAWVPGGGTEFKLPEDTDERRPLYSATALERVRRERNDARWERDVNFAEAKRVSSEYHVLGKENLANHRKARAAEAKLAEALVDIAAQAERMARLEEALKPFARVADCFSTDKEFHPDSMIVWSGGDIHVRVGDFRRARALSQEGSDA